MKPYMDTDEALDHLQQTDIDGIVNLYGNLALSAGNGTRALGASARPRTPSEDEVVRGVIELHADGECVHKIEDKIVYEHHLSLSQKMLNLLKR